jgi:hypothetical protein
MARRGYPAVVNRPDSTARRDATAPVGDRLVVPAPLKIAITIVACEGLAFVGLAGFELAALQTNRPAVALTSTAFFLICAASLLACARGLWRLSRWARSPVVLAQLIALLSAYSLWSDGFRYPAAMAGIPAIITLGCLFHPASIKALSSPGEDA